MQKPIKSPPQQTAATQGVRPSSPGRFGHQPSMGRSAEGCDPLIARITDCLAYLGTTLDILHGLQDSGVACSDLELRAQNLSYHLAEALDLMDDGAWPESNNAAWWPAQHAKVEALGNQVEALCKSVGVGQ